MDKALREIEYLLGLEPFVTEREKRIYSIACAALNIEDEKRIKKPPNPRRSQKPEARNG